MTLLVIALVAFLIEPFVMSIGEWMIHKYAMHTRWSLLSFPYEAHDQTHHPAFSAKKYNLSNRPQEEMAEDSKKITMAWWGWVVVILAGMFPSAIVALPFTLFSWWSAVFTIVGIGAFYAALNYTIYEIIHWCMHVPRGRRLENWPIFKWLNQHHELHHRNPSTNLNVVFPFADWLFGTLCTVRRVVT